VYSEKGGLTEALCKPKIMPIQSVTLEQLTRMQREAAAAAAASAAQDDMVANTRPAAPPILAARRP
jgi:hypothetical protein